MLIRPFFGAHRRRCGAVFRDPPPDRDAYVLGQAIAFNPDQWITRQPSGEWMPRGLADLPRAGRWPTVDRRTVFRMAEHADTPQGRRDLLIATLVWGTGTNAREVGRRVRIRVDRGASHRVRRL